MELGLAIILVAIAFMVWSLVKVSDDENIGEDIREEDEENG